MPLDFSGFDWDDGNRSKCHHHGVTLSEVEDLFLKPITVLPDPEHSRTEERFKAIRNRRIALPSAARFFAATEQEMTPEIEFGGVRLERFARDEARTSCR